MRRRDDEILRAYLQQALAATAQQAFGIAVRVNEVTEIQVVHHDGLRRVLHQHPKPLFTLTQLGFRLTPPVGLQQQGQQQQHHRRKNHGAEYHVEPVLAPDGLPLIDHYAVRGQVPGLKVPALQRLRVKHRNAGNGDGGHGRCKLLPALEPIAQALPDHGAQAFGAQQVTPCRAMAQKDLLHGKDRRSCSLADGSEDLYRRVDLAADIAKERRIQDDSLGRKGPDTRQHLIKAETVGVFKFQGLAKLLQRGSRLRQEGQHGVIGTADDQHALRAGT